MIPNILWQTWKTKSVPSEIKKQADSWKVSNPQLDIKLCDDLECSNFILEHFGKEIHNLYVSLPQPIMRADFWRIAVVYVYGGYYADLDITCNSHISNFTNSSVNSVFIKELDNIANFFFGAEAKHPVLKIALDSMIEESKHIIDKETQSFGMHSLHKAVRDYYKVLGTDYPNNNQTQTLSNEHLKHQKILIHSAASLTAGKDYHSWRISVDIMNKERDMCNDILFFTTFNKNGFDLYGKVWIDSFIILANYYNKIKAKIYYEGFEPTINHPSITWVKYEEAISFHPKWKADYLRKSTHSEYVKTMTVRFSHKAFVIQHALDNNTNDYLIWLDGDCVFKNSDYQQFPKNILEDKFLACQIEHNHDLNHVESGILIFKGNHPDIKKFNNEFKKNYQVENILPMGQPYDGFLVFKSLLTSQVNYVDLNKSYGKGGIQSDPSMTFCHPEINSKFIHNIGWTGKNQYDNWSDIFKRDDIYIKMKSMLFGGSNTVEMQIKKENAFNKLEKLKKMRK
jgi:mannosyltransferase OCH1-like enzyme